MFVSFVSKLRCVLLLLWTLCSYVWADVLAIISPTYYIHVPYLEQTIYMRLILANQMFGRYNHIH